MDMFLEIDINLGENNVMADIHTHCTHQQIAIKVHLIVLSYTSMSKDCQFYLTLLKGQFTPKKSSFTHPVYISVFCL